MYMKKVHYATLGSNIELKSDPFPKFQIRHAWLGPAKMLVDRLGPKYARYSNFTESLGWHAIKTLRIGNLCSGPKYKVLIKQ